MAWREAVQSRYYGVVPPVARRYTERVCPDCGATFQRRSGKPTGRCIDCASDVFVAAARASVERAGPIYERVVVGQLRHWHAEAERLGLPLV